MKQFRDEHQATMLNEFKQENVDDFIKKQMVCKEKFHEKNKLVYYCKEKTCKICICQSCCILSHKDHNMSLIEEEAEQAKQLIQDYANRINQMNKKFSEKLTLSEQKMVKIESEIDLAKQKVEKEKESIIKKAQAHAKAMTESLDKILLDEQLENEVEQDSIETDMEQIAEFEEYNQTVLEKGITLEILESQEGVKLRGKAIERFFASLPPKPAEHLSVHYEVNQQFKGSLDNIGKIAKNVKYPKLKKLFRLFRSFVCLLVVFCLFVYMIFYFDLLRKLDDLLHQLHRQSRVYYEERF